MWVFEDGVPPTWFISLKIEPDRPAALGVAVCAVAGRLRARARARTAGAHFDMETMYSAELRAACEGEGGAVHLPTWPGALQLFPP